MQINMSKKIKLDSLRFTNHAHFSNLECKFDGTLTYLIGLNGSGKTTIINAMWTAIHGIAQKGQDCVIGERFKFIKPGSKSMDIEVELIDESRNNAKIIIKRHITRTTSKLTFHAPNDYQISHEWLKNLLSVAFLSAKHFTQKNKKEQSLLLGIDTAEFDKQLADLKLDRQVVNRELKNLGQPKIVEKVERVDIEKLQTEKYKLQEEFDEQYQENQEHNRELDKQQEKIRQKLLISCNEFNQQQDAIERKLDRVQSAYQILEADGYGGIEVVEWIELLPKRKPHRKWEELVKKLPEPDYIPEMPDKSAIEEIDQQIVDAYETNQQAAAYSNYLKDLKRLKDKKTELAALDEKKKALTEKRNDYIQSYDLPFAGLTIDEDGGLLYQDREIREPFFSKGQLEMIVHQLYSKTNNELKIRFIDDFDSLDEENQVKLTDYLIGEGYQIIAAKVGRAENSKNIIALSEKVQKPKTQKPEII
jgi:DNA repair ATPase RecN